MLLKLSIGAGWGKYDQGQGISNPLGVFSDHFKDRSQAKYSQGGTLNAAEWFTGDASIFGGIEFYIPYGKGLKFKIENDPFDYFDFSAGVDGAGVTAAYHQTEVDIGGANAADEEATHMGVSFAVNDDLTVSYAIQEVDINGAGEDERNSGFGVSYTMGSMSVAAYAGKTENGNGVSTADDEGKGLTLSIAF